MANQHDTGTLPRTAPTTMADGYYHPNPLQQPGTQSAHPPPRPESIDSDLAELWAEDTNPNQIVNFAPKENFKLGYFDVMCLVFNRMIGTGIFMSPQRVMQGTQSTGAALLLWFAGVIYCLAGMYVYIEYGLNVPRYAIMGVEQSVPRSGGELNYLQYVYRKPAYRKNTILLSTVLFGISFIILGNMAGNSMQFATRVLLASGHADPPPNGSVRAIAICSAIFACFIHAFSRRGGILLNNLLAVVKLGMLLLVIAVAIAAAAGAFGTDNVIAQNTDARVSFGGSHAGDSFGYARAFLAVVFSVSGFEQPNYVLGEISRPRKTFPVAMTVAVSTVMILYMVVNICYMVVVPRDEQITHNVALRFIELTLGRLSSNSQTSYRIFNAFLAISSMGNVIVMTYTAARVKQEIAKEGILPWARFFAQNTDLSLGRLLRWFRFKGWFGSLLRLRWLNPEHHTERTPVGALSLHFLFCFILTFATYGLGPDGTYALLTSVTSYAINCFFGMFLGLGILILRFRGPPVTASEQDAASGATGPAEPRPQPSWKTYTGKRFPPWLSVPAAGIYFLANLYPLIASWIPPTRSYTDLVGVLHPWYAAPLMGCCVLAFAFAWYVGFLWVARRKEAKYHQVFVVEKKPDFEAADDDKGRHRESMEEGGGSRRGGFVLVHETVYLSWIAKETLRQRGSNRRTEGGAVEDDGSPDRQFSGTDFAGYHGAS